MQQLNFQGKTKEQEAIEFIQSIDTQGQPLALMYSGGKDSIVMEYLTSLSGVPYKVYYSLMHDAPEVLQFIKRRPFPITIIRAKFNFWKGLVTHYPPHRKAAWCCGELKEQPSRKIALTHRLVGIRAEESPKRALKGRINRITKKRINYHPLFYFQEWEIWDVIEKARLEYPSLYDEGFSRLGCVICPKRSTADQKVYLRKYPQYKRLFEKQVRKWWEAKGKFRETETATSCEQFLDNWYRGK
jgi:phosphoadenosine phosphosulfate reductase